MVHGGSEAISPVDWQEGLDILAEHGWNGDRVLDVILVPHRRVPGLLDKGFLTLGECGLL